MAELYDTLRKRKFNRNSPKHENIWNGYKFYNN